MAHTRKTLLLDSNWDICLTGGTADPYGQTFGFAETGAQPFDRGTFWQVERPLTGYGAKIALAQGAYATAQNVANECRLFTNDAYFEPSRGIPYYLVALGQKLSPSVLRARLRDAALLVEDVEDVTDVVLESLDTETRRVTGEIQFTSREGENAAVEL
jgi:hypothetical protein